MNLEKILATIITFVFILFLGFTLWSAIFDDDCENCDSCKIEQIEKYEN